MLLGSLLPVTFPVTRKTCWLFPWSGDLGQGIPVPLPPRDQQHKSYLCLPAKSGDCFQICELKVWLDFLWTHLHFPSCSFLHLLFWQQSHCLLSPIHKIFSCFSQSNVRFVFFFFILRELLESPVQSHDDD